VVERRPEKAGVASSILAPGTTVAAKTEQISSARCDVDPALRRQGDFLDVFGDLRADDRWFAVEHGAQARQAHLYESPRVVTHLHRDSARY
jgi:hypothetical protein